MKTILKIILILILGLIIGGYILENYYNQNGKLYIGSGVFLFAFILMPLFVYQRYNGRIGDFIDKRMEQPPKKEN
ncbi:MAG: hypothetical protein V3U80_10760 [Flavobacteriaceae bacterium]